MKKILKFIIKKNYLKYILKKYKIKKKQYD